MLMPCCISSRINLFTGHGLDLGHIGDPRQHLQDPILHQRRHALLLRTRRHLRNPRPLLNQPLDLRRRHQQLVQPHPPPIPPLITPPPPPPPGPPPPPPPPTPSPAQAASPYACANSATCAALAAYGTLHPLHSVRANRCAKIPSSASAKL